MSIEEELKASIQNKNATIESLKSELHGLERSNSELKDRWVEYWKLPRTLFNVIVIVCGILFSLNIAQQYFATSHLRQTSDQLSNRAEEAYTHVNEIRKTHKEFIVDHEKEVGEIKKNHKKSIDDFNHRIEGILDNYTTIQESLTKQNKDQADHYLAQAELARLKSIIDAIHYKCICQVLSLQSIARQQLSLKHNPDRAANTILEARSAILNATTQAGEKRNDVITLCKNRGLDDKSINDIYDSRVILNDISFSNELLLAECYLVGTKWDRLLEESGNNIHACCNASNDIDDRQCYDKERFYYYGLASLYKWTVESDDSVYLTPNAIISNQEPTPANAQELFDETLPFPIARNQNSAALDMNIPQEHAYGNDCNLNAPCCIEGQHLLNALECLSYASFVDQGSTIEFTKIFYASSLLAYGNYNGCTIECNEFLQQYENYPADRLSKTTQSEIAIAKSLRNLSNYILGDDSKLETPDCELAPNAIPSYTAKLYEAFFRKIAETRQRHADYVKSIKSNANHDGLGDRLGIQAVNLIIKLRESCDNGYDPECPTCQGKNAIQLNAVNTASLLAEYNLPERVGYPRYSFDASLGISHLGMRIMKSKSPKLKNGNIIMGTEYSIFKDDERVPAGPYVEMDKSELSVAIRYLKKNGLIEVSPAN